MVADNKKKNIEKVTNVTNFVRKSKTIFRHPPAMH